MLKSLCKKVNRTKKLDPDIMSTPLKRCLNTFDICLLGVGHMVGAGFYVLTGDVAKNIAGPGIVLSYIIAGFTSMLAALCYAEFGARVPRAGSAYVYTYVTIGEFWAFVVGWNVLLEHMIGAASVARAWSGYLDSFFNEAIRNGTMTYVGQIHVDFFGHYPDFIACLVCLVLGACLTMGVKGSSYVNSVLTIVNLGVVTFVICFGLYWADSKNWYEVEGGFLPYGFTGVVAGAGACFYAFVGFDSIATSGEEAKNPQRSIPLATFLAMGIVTLAYVLVSITLTLMVPYNTIHPSAALPDAFAANGASWAKYMVAGGALAGMTTTLFGGLFALPRCVYAMAMDGLFFKVFCQVNPTTQVPVINLVVCAICTSIIALLFELEKLVEFMSIGTLMAYTIVSVSVIVLRYQPAEKYTLYSPETGTTAIAPSDSKEELTKDADMAGRLKPSFLFLESVLDCAPGFVVNNCILLMTVFLAAFCSIIKLASHELSQAVWWAVLLLVIFLGGALVCLLIVCLYEQNKQPLAFKVPFVPFVPALSVFLNLALMTNLHYMTWLRFGFWLLMGMLVYFGYGIHHSKENEPLSAYSALLVSSEASKEPWGSMQETIHRPQMSREDSTEDDRKPFVQEGHE